VSAIERWRRIQGLRAAENPHLRLPAPLPVIDSCILRMDAPSINDTMANKSVGSIFGSIDISNAAGIAINTQVGQLPGPTGVWGVAVADDPTKFFRPGHWVIKLPAYLQGGTSAGISVVAQFVPFNPVTGVFVRRPFLGGTGSAFSAPALELKNGAIASIRETVFEFETFFPEPWGVFFSTGGVAFGAADRYRANAIFQLHCPTDDVPEALSPFVPAP
jgi:hypothetical protein